MQHIGRRVEHPAKAVAAKVADDAVAMLFGMNLDGVAARGYAFQVEMALRSKRAGGHVVEVPIVFVERTLGSSKMTTAIVLEALWLVTKWAFYKSA